MKLKYLFLLIQISYTSSVFASDSAIIFRNINYEEIFLIAEKENKNIFLYFHFDECGACRKMENTTFTDPGVADYYNNNFICFEVNTLKGEGIEINKHYNIKLHPTFLYLDKNRNELHKTVGIFSPSDFLSHAKSLNNKLYLSELKRKYDEGERDAEFLFNYCYGLRDASELDSLTINEYLQTLNPDDYTEEKNIRFIYEFVLHRGRSMLDLDSKAFQFLLNNKEIFYEYFEKDQVIARIVFNLNNINYYALEKGDKIKFDKSLELLSPYDTGNMYFYKELDGRMTGIITSTEMVATAYLAYQKKWGTTEQYNKVLNEYIIKIWDKPRELNNLAWDAYMNSDDVGELNNAKRCIERSVELSDQYYNNDTYAAVLFKLKEYDVALQRAEKAITLAKSSGKNYDSTTQLMNEITEKIIEQKK